LQTDSPREFVAVTSGAIVARQDVTVQYLNQTSSSTKQELSHATIVIIIIVVTIGLSCFVFCTCCFFLAVGAGKSLSSGSRRGSQSTTNAAHTMYRSSAAAFTRPVNDAV
jgi:streptolysin S family bacteriocin protoxin